MEYWRQCAAWLIGCNVLPTNHRVTADSAQVFDLAQTLRDGVLLCQLLNNLRPGTINLKEINLRPQMSQFLCLKNIRTFLASCCDVFGLKKSDLFEAFDLFDVRDFGKVTNHERDVRICCLTEIKQTEEKYTETLESIEKVECSKRANNGKFTLRDLLVVPMQRILKYHLLLQELVKHTHDAADKSNLKIALDAMKDLAQYVNEMKRDNETLREIDQYQRSIENLNQPLFSFGRPKGDGEVRIISSVDRRKQDRHIFLFDLAVIVCKRRGDNYDLKDILDLNYFKITNNPTSDREGKKWCYGFYVTHQQGYTGFELFFKTRELKKKWLDQFEMAISNIRPEKASHNSHQFKMHTFERITSCSFCHLLLRGIFNQGYLCVKCGLGAHKECLECKYVCIPCLPGLPRMVVIRDYSGTPHPQCGPPLSIHVGDVIELMFADLHSSWWQGKILATSKIGFFPSDAVRPCPCVKMIDCSLTAVVVHGWYRFAGPMERYQAEVELLDRGNSTYLVRHRSKESTEYAISIKFNDKIKHIKILTKDGCFYIAESRLFKTVLDLVEYYKQHSLKEGFSSLDTTLQVPYREISNGNMPRAITETASGETTQTLSFVLPSSSPFWSVFSPRVVGIAVARYDFSSRDTRELSLLQGDIIKIYTKISSGWWKGEVDGRVGWFPSTYVEEED
uniref:Guanine nucleotide exchange factor VAV3-like n=1 Tax=Echeneis naucrates TaxID=173247 RepID=A0A665WZ32_ECHNA